jgi:hypothetical protein
MRFSQRVGLTPIKSLIQIDSVDEALKNALWNAMQVVVWDSHRCTTNYASDYTVHSNLYAFLRAYWQEFFKQPIDELPNTKSGCIKAIRGYFFGCEWYEIYDLIEFTAQKLGNSRQKFIDQCNAAFEKEVAGYRFIDEQIAPITSPIELNAIEETVNGVSDNPGAHTHLKRAIELMSDRTNPDYRNSIKESISAVEAIAQKITNDPSATLGAALKAVSKDAEIHPALKSSLSSLYGYTSDSSGIRHALLDEPNLDFIDAKFMLVACCAFVNYLLGKSSAV